jgi:hypothetical protein
MKQIALGIMQYTQDYDEMLPPSRNASVANKTTPWHYLIQPSIGSTAIFKRPTNQSDPDSDANPSCEWVTAINNAEAAMK